MNSSIVGFKTRTADLHRKSPAIFMASLVFSLILTIVLIHTPLPEKKNTDYKIEVPPVILMVENIPKTRHLVSTPAPAKPYVQGSQPIAVDDDILPDEITIEDTNLEPDDTPPTLPFLLVPEEGTTVVEEEEIYEYFAVEEEPKIFDTVIPEYPKFAERAGIEGTIHLKILVNKKGLVDSVKVIKGPKIFHKPSIDAAKKTTFIPAKQYDKPVACWVIIPFKFIAKKE